MLRIRLNGILASLARATMATALLALAACGESKEDAAFRQTLAPLLQRNQSLNQELADWVAAGEKRSDTWKNVFDKYDEFLKEKEEIQKSARGIVPTPRYGCVTSLLQRELASDIDMLQARRSVVQQRFRASLASDRADEMHRQGMASDYSAEIYFSMASKARAELKEALQEAESFQISANRSARSSVAIADSLGVAIKQMKILPEVSVPRVPIIATSGDSLLRADTTEAISVCGVSRANSGKGS